MTAGTAMLASLHNRIYRLFASGQVVSLVGTWMQRVAQDWLVLTLSGGSPVALGVAAALQFGPTLLDGGRVVAVELDRAQRPDQPLGGPLLRVEIPSRSRTAPSDPEINDQLPMPALQHELEGVLVAEREAGPAGS